MRSRFLRTGRATRYVLWLAIAGLSCTLAFHLFYERRAEGTFDQVIVVESPRAVRAVWYSPDRIDDERRELMESLADIRLLEVRRQAEPLGENRFRAWAWYYVRSSGLRPNRITHLPHMALFVEFADGAGACRVVEILPGRGAEPVVVRLP